MGLFGLSFGKKRHVSKRRSTKKHHKVAKPPARLLSLCKKYRVKATKKVGGKRVYKKVSILKKLCLRKARALRKKMMKMHKKKMAKKSKKKMTKKSKKTHRRPRRDAFGKDEDMMSFGRSRVPMFGKRRSTGKVSKKNAMKAFRSFYKRHCAGARKTRFGNGGNPALNASMGYEFCPNGMGGVLGFNSTGLFPSPCTSYSSSAPAMGQLPPPVANAFGMRHHRSAAGGMHRKRRSTAAGAVKRKSATGGVRRKRKCGSGVKRKSAAGGMRRKRRSHV